MIKGLCYSKFLKQSLIGFGISCFILLGSSVSAWRDTITVYQNGSYIDSPSDSQLKFAVYGRGMLSSQRLGITRRMIALTSVDNNRSYFWWHDGIPYFYYYFANGNTFFQGHATKYKICDPLTMGDTIYRNCSDESVSNLSFVEEVQPFFNSITSSDLFGISNDAYTIGVGYGPTYNIHVCFSSSSYGKSICFITEDGLDNSLGLGENLTMGDISQVYFGDPPGWSTSNTGTGGTLEGSTSTVIDNTMTGDYTYATCTRNDILTILNSEGYNRYLCYGGLDNFDLYDSSLNYNPVPGAGKSIGDIRAWSGSRAWDTFTDWFTFWYGLYIDNSNNYNAMRESYPAVYRTYFQLFTTYAGSVEPRTVLEYCNLLNFDPSVMNNPAGGYFSPTCDTVIREKQTGVWQSRVDGTIYSGGIYTGTVPVSVNRSGVGNMSGLEVQGDGMTFLQNFFTLVKSKLNTKDYSGTGALPSYIVVFLLALILFRFLSH